MRSVFACFIFAFICFSTALFAQSYCELQESPVDHYHREGQEDLQALGEGDDLLAQITGDALLDEETFDRVSRVLEKMPYRIEFFQKFEEALFDRLDERDFNFSNFHKLLDELYGEGGSRDLWHTHLRVLISDIRSLLSLYNHDWPLPQTADESIFYAVQPESQTLLAHPDGDFNFHENILSFYKKGATEYIDQQLGQRTPVPIRIYDVKGVSRDAYVVGRDSQGRYLLVKKQTREPYDLRLNLESFRLEGDSHQIAIQSMIAKTEIDHLRTKHTESPGTVLHPDYQLPELEPRLDP